MEKKYELTDETMQIIASYMIPESRELICELGVKNSFDFLILYCDMDKNFLELLKNEFYFVYEMLESYYRCLLNV